MGKIKWTEKSSASLQAIHEYIARDSKTYATRFITSLIKATEKLEMMPWCGRIVPELEGYGFREVMILLRYLLLCTVLVKLKKYYGRNGNWVNRDFLFRCRTVGSMAERMGVLALAPLVTLHVVCPRQGSFSLTSQLAGFILY